MIVVVHLGYNRKEIYEDLEDLYAQTCAKAYEAWKEFDNAMNDEGRRKAELNIATKEVLIEMLEYQLWQYYGMTKVGAKYKRRNLAR